MKKAWKWILGIIIVLVIVAAVVAVPLLRQNYMAARIPANSTNTLPQGRGWNGNGNGDGNSWNMMPGYGNQQRQGGFNGRGGPMMGGGRGFGGGFSPFGFGFMFLGGILRLIPWILLGLILWGVYQLGRRSGLRANQVTPVASVPAAAAAPAQPVVIEPDAPQNPTA